MTDRDPLAPRGTLSLTVDMALLRSMKITELNGLRDAMHTLGQISAALTCQPRFGHSEKDFALNKAGSIIEDIKELIEAYEEATVKVARAMTPATRSEAIERSWLLLAFEADMQDGLGALAVMAAEGMRDQEKFD